MWMTRNSLQKDSHFSVVYLRKAEKLFAFFLTADFLCRRLFMWHDFNVFLMDEERMNFILR